MRVFEEPNMSNNWKCPICGTNDKKEVVLVGIDGTDKGTVIQARQYHLSCIELIEYTIPKGNDVLVAMRFRKNE